MFYCFQGDFFKPLQSVDVWTENEFISRKLNECRTVLESQLSDVSKTLRSLFWVCCDAQGSKDEREMKKKRFKSSWLFKSSH